MSEGSHPSFDAKAHSDWPVLQRPKTAPRKRLLFAANDLQNTDVRDASFGSNRTEAVAVVTGRNDGRTPLLHDGSASLGDALHTGEGVHLEGGQLGAEVGQRSLALGDVLLVADLGVCEARLPDLDLRLEDFGGALGDELISGHSGNLHYHSVLVKGSV